MLNGKDKIIYFDHASTTPVDERVLESMMPYFCEIYGNSSSIHSVGRRAVKAVDEARETISKIIGSKFEEVYFTSGGTESDNWAIKGTYLNRGDKNKIVTSSIEHLAVINAVNSLEGVEKVFISPNNKGIVSFNDYFNAVDNNTFLTCLMAVNNEVGTIQPIEKVCKIAHDKGSLFFTDAVQFIGSSEVNVKTLGVDMLSASSHKFNGPKGVGFLYVKNGVKISPLLDGGHQERSKRASTTNVAGIVGMAKALSLTRKNLDRDSEYVKNIRDTFISRVLNEIEGTSLCGDANYRSVNNASITFSGVNGDNLIFALDLRGVCASIGSACSAGSIEPSYVLTEMGISRQNALSTIRFTFGKENTIDEVNYAVEVIKECIKNLK